MPHTPLLNFFRNNKYGRVLYSLIIAFIYVIYVSLSDIYMYLPPLIGVMFVIFHSHYDDVPPYISSLVIVCLVYFECDKLLVVGIMPVVFFILHLFISHGLESTISVNKFFVFLYVALLYSFYIAGMMMCNILFGTYMLDFSAVYIYYFVLDCILALVYYIRK